MSDRFGKAKYATIRRDFNNLRECIRRWDPEAAEAAWEKCERWLEALPLRADGGRDMTDPCKPLEDAVLLALPGRVAHPSWGNEFYHGLSRIAKEAGVDREAARFGCRRLRDKGLAIYQAGLFTDEGEVAGAGYALTAEGRTAAALIAQEGET